MKKSAILCTVILFVLLAVVCGCQQEPAPAPTRTAELPIPAHFTTYTDEANTFSISFPPDWETAVSIIPGLEESTREALRDVEFDVPLEEYTAVFFSGLPRGDGYLPNVNINVGPAIGSTLDEEFEASLRGLKASAEDLQLFEQIKTVIGGREAIVLDYAFTLPGTPPGTPRFRCLVTVILVDKVTWTVTCGTAEKEFLAN